jgi:hypothetical protein
MARVSIYVTDDLKKRMDATGDAINWSNVAQPAFLAALATHEHRRGPTMQTAIERLKASKAQYEAKQSADGKEAGRLWAANTATYEDLVKVSKIDLDGVLLDGVLLDAPSSMLFQALTDDGNLTPNDVAENCFGEEAWPSEDYVVAFIEGAQEFFDEIQDEI